MAAAATYPVSTIAKLLMLTERRVQHLAKEGILPRAERGRYELVPVVQAYIKYLRDRAINGDAAEVDGGHRARLIKARADIAEMEAERLAGDLAPVEEIEKAWTGIISRFRQRSLAVAPKAAPMVAVENTTEACHEIIETFIHEALAELAAIAVEGHPATAERGSGGIGDGGTAAEADNIGMGGSL